VANVRGFDVQSSDFANGAGFASVKEIERIGAELIAIATTKAAELVSNVVNEQTNQPVEAVPGQRGSHSVF
jgi:hypothetical protein